MDKPLNELDLSLVVCVVARPSHDSTKAFHFQVHFSATKGSPWILRAQSQVCKLYRRSENDSCQVYDVPEWGLMKGTKACNAWDSTYGLSVL